MSTRRLSVSEDISHGDPTLSQIIEECAAMEADLGLSLSERSNSYHGLDAAQEVERIAFALYQEALAFENKMQQTKSARQPIFPSLPSSPASQHQHLKGAANNTGQKGAGEGYQFSPSELTTSQDYWRVRLPEPSPSSTLPLGIASQPIFSSAPPAFRPTPPSAWLQQGVYASPQPDVGAYRSVGGPQPLVAAGYSVGLLPQAAALLPEDADRRYSRKRRRIGASQVVYSEVDPDLWLDAAPMIDGSPEGKRKSQSPSPQGLSPEQAAPGLCSARQVPTGKANLRDAGQGTLAKVSASSVWEASAAAPAASGAATSLQADSITAHPYVRLPGLQEGVEPPHIWLWASNFWTSNGLSLDQILLSFRRVFTKHELNQLDATLLGEYVQELAVASAARARGTKRMNRPLHGSVIIGRQFLVLDAIVSAMHVFGVSTAACSWWRPFIDCFDTNYRYNEPQRLTRNSGRGNIDLANRMLAAISISTLISPTACWPPSPYTKRENGRIPKKLSI
ncbi:hypothetical protein EPH_0006430 [Eimeria praecox]|uniref:Uncharacterized protein n=1 Tax=Eimeria praecox TaxID=51316 RepID=U6G6G7_9EIME|nr:hypothetical protein EPH_0006430 [Eimeria praecox]